MKRVLFAVAQISVVVWAAAVVYQHDLRDPSEVMPFLAALVLRSWISKDIDDPLFGKQTAHGWIITQLKRLAPKRQPKSRWDI
jgi:hypothetical protein